MEKKLGILCYWGVSNFGAWAQAYALNRIVREMVGDRFQVEHIQYLYPQHYAACYRNGSDVKRINSFHYSYEVIPHSRRYTAEELEQQQYDVIITGSDAIWEFSVPAFGADQHMFGLGLKTEKLIAYAASFGIVTPDYPFESWVADGLSRYDYLSVRDTNSADVVETLIGFRPQVVLDPALLWDFRSDPIVAEPKLEQYILVYGSHWTEQFIEEAQKFAKEKGCKLISAGYINRWCDTSFRLIEMRGWEWIGMFQNAEYVLTSMFHGLMVGLSFGKQVKFCRVPYVKNRSQSLLEELELEQYLTEEIVEADVFSKELDFGKISIKLGQMREKSLAYLRRSLVN